MKKIVEQNNISGPFTDYLLEQSLKKKDIRFRDEKKKKSKLKMSGKIPNIKLIDDESEPSIKIKNDTSIDNINLIQDSDDDSVVTLPRNNKNNSSSNDSTPVLKPKRKVPSLPKMANDEFKYFMNSRKQKPVITKEESESEEEESEEESDDESESSSDSDDETPKENNKSSNNRDNEKKKQEILIKLLALEKKGVSLTKTYSLKSSLDELEFEYNTQKHSAEVEASVHFQQKMLMAAVTGAEFLNKKFDPIGAKLDGWSESVMDNITDYEEIFAQLHEKYSEKASMPPELQLLVTLVGSGFMFHLTNTLFKSTLPGLGDVLKSNPDIMKNISSAMGQAMNQSQGLTPNKPNTNSSTPMSSFIPPPQQNNDMSGPSVDLSSMMNQFTSGPPQPMMQQAPKQKTDDSDRFSIASSSDGSEIKSVSISNPKGKGKGKGKSIRI